MKQIPSILTRIILEIIIETLKMLIDNELISVIAMATKEDLTCCRQAWQSQKSALLNDLSDKPDQGTSIGKNCFKIRLAISSKGKGKSGSARIK